LPVNDHHRHTRGGVSGRQATRRGGIVRPAAGSNVDPFSSWASKSGAEMDDTNYIQMKQLMVHNANTIKKQRSGVYFQKPKKGYFSGDSWQHRWSITDQFIAARAILLRNY
jgi:hypothetical protein